MKQTPLQRKTPLKRTASKPRRKSVSPASPAQRTKTASMGFCVVCGQEGSAYSPLTSMHLIDRSLGGCDDPLCTLPAHKKCHDAYDLHEVDLLKKVEPRFREEQAHAVGHIGIAGAYRRLTGDRAYEEAA